MSMMELNNLWAYIQGLGLVQSDREWLASKLVEPTEKEEGTPERPYKVIPVSPEIERWSNCASFTANELENDPRLKTLLSR